MNRVIGFPAQKWRCGLTLPRSDLGSLGSPIKLSFSQVVCNMDLGLWAPSIRDSGWHRVPNRVLVSNLASYGRWVASPGP